jgi:Fe-S cluster assembly scaffold protein SufB
MIQISDKVKLESEGEKHLVSVPENLKEEIKIFLDKDSEIKINVGKNSEVKIVGVSKNSKNVEINVGENSKLDWLDFSYGDSIKSFIKTNLDSNSEGKILNVIFGNESNEFKIDNKVVHAGDNSKSDMIVRAVMNDKARVIQTGLVKVEKNTKNCEGYQQSDVILLSEDSYAESVPNLEIFNNNVKCSHGATISQVDEDKLFYLRSRGLTEKEAKKAVIEGFFNPILEEFSEEVKEEVLVKIGEI